MQFSSFSCVRVSSESSQVGASFSSGRLFIPIASRLRWPFAAEIYLSAVTS